MSDQLQHPAVGIDLGTTNSAIAWLDDLGRPQTLINAEGDKVTPSAVLFEGDNVVVGKEAIKALATEADQVAQCAKRSLGYRYFQQDLGGRQYPPEALQAFVLDKLRVDAARQIGAFTKAVITVPAYFDEVRRKATEDAGYIAALDVLDIINEPTAAAVAFGFQQSVSPAGTPRGVQRILVYDLGGGTFDVTVLEIEGSEFTALATDGDVQLGGHDWDHRLIDLMAEKFQEQHGLDPRTDPNTLGRLWRECEDAKRTLSARDKASIACDFQGQAIRTEVTRDEFHSRTADLVERTRFTTRQTLEASGLDWDEIDKVLLVGGSTRMPAIREMLTEMSGKEPDNSVSPDEAVAHGAALRAGFLLARERGEKSRFRIKNVNSHSLGVVGTDPQTKRDRVAVLIPRNTPIPVTAKRVFKTKTSNQKSILVRVVEGESSSPTDCVPLGDCVVDKLPPNLPAQTRIEVRFGYEENGRLTVEVDVEGVEGRQRLELKRENSMNREQLDEWRKHVSKVPPPESDDHGIEL
ncbi:MAG: Hsp70 family protein [Planctomycetota bacterium]